MIVLSRVELVNFLSHRRTTLDFVNGVNVIVGENGAGKSSIIDAVIFGLFRETGREGNNQDLVRTGEKIARVSLEVLDESRKLVVERHIPTTQGRDILKLDGKVVAHSSKEVSAWIQRFIGMDREVLLNTVIMPQGRIEEVLDQKVLERSIRRLIKVEQMENLLESGGPLKLVIKELKSQLQLIDERRRDLERERAQEEEIEAKVEELKREAEELKAEIRKIEEGLEIKKSLLEEMERKRINYLELSAKLKSLRNNESELVSTLRDNAVDLEQLEKLRVEIEELERLERLWNELRQRRITLENMDSHLRDLRSQRDEALRKLSRKREIEALASEYLSVRDRIEELHPLHEEYVASSSSVRDKEEEVKRMVEKAQELDLEMERVRGEIGSRSEGDMIALLEDMKAERSSRELRIVELKGAVEELRKAKGRCPVCGAQLTEEHRDRLLREYEEELQKLVTRSAQLKEEIEKLELEYEGLRKLTQRLISVETTLKEVRAELTKREKELAEAKERLNSLTAAQSEYKELTKREKELRAYYDEYRSLSDYSEERIAEMERRINEVEMQRGVQERELRELEIRLKGFNPDEVRRKRSTLEELIRRKERYEEAMRQLNRVREEILSVQAQLDYLAFDQGQYEGLRRETEELRSEVEERKGRLLADQKLLQQLEQQVERVRERRKELEDYVKRGEVVSKGLETLSKLEEVLGRQGLQRYLIQASKEAIERYASRVLENFDLPYVDVEIGKGETVVPYLRRNDGREIGVNMLSGGERVAVAIALRLALANLYSSKVGFVVMDEPTVHLDEQRKKELMNVILRGKEILSQIIVVTHDDELKVAGDLVIEVKKVNNVSSISIGGG